MSKFGPRKTTREFKQEVYNLVGNEYSVLGEYITNKTKIKMRHNKCGYEYEVTPNSFLSTGNRCRECWKKRVGKFLHTPELEEKAYYERNVNKTEEEKEFTSKKLSKMLKETWSNRSEQEKERILQNSVKTRFQPNQPRIEKVEKKYAYDYEELRRKYENKGE